MYGMSRQTFYHFAHEVYLINDWPAFVSRIDDSKNIYLSVESLDPEPMACSSSFSAEYDFMECLGALRGKWTGAASPACADVFAHLFWSYHENVRYRIVEIGNTQRPFGLDVAWGPGTMKRFLESAQRVDLEECRSIFAPGGQDRFQTYEEFAEYGSFWLDVVRRGAESGRGLAVVVCG
jgi:hypothetical protein